jgi:DNA modification methylase
LKVSIHTLRENPENPRSISGEKFEKLVNSIRQFPEMMEARPIVVDQNNVILGGNMRFKAAKEAGLQEVDVYVASWDEAKNPEFIIKDNVGFGEWDWDMLANEWDAVLLDDWGLDVWQEEEEKEGLTDPDEVPEVPADPVTQLGDLWILGEHRLLCGDSTKAEDVERLMDGSKADMVFTDPPYALFGNSTGATVADDKMIRPFFRDIAKSMLRACKPASHFYSCLDWKSWSAVLDSYTQAGLTAKNMIVWDKGNAALGQAYRSQHELIMFGLVASVGVSITKSLGVEIGQITDANVWTIKREPNQGMHSALKPQEVMIRAIKNSSDTDALVLDLFLGSGSTLIACQQTGRKCYGMELDPKYCDVIVKRWEDFTGQKASKANA